MKKVTARRAGAAVARQSLRQFDREMKALDKATKVAQPVVEEEQAAELVSRPTEIKTVAFQMNGKRYQTVSSWTFVD